MNYYAIRVNYKNYEKNKLMKMFQSLGRDLKYLDIESIKQIVRFKWETYTRDYFIRRFYIFLIFIFSLLLDFMYCSSDTDVIFNNNSELACNVSTQSLCSLVLIFFVIHEIKSYNRDKDTYQNDPWNYSDLLLIIAFIFYLPLSYLYSDILLVKSV